MDSSRARRAPGCEVGARAACFTELRDALEGLSCPAEVLGPGPGALLLRVHRPGRLGGVDVLCVWTEGEWWFTWEDGHTIGPAEDHAGAAIAIYRVLHKGPVSS